MRPRRTTTAEEVIATVNPVVDRSVEAKVFVSKPISRGQKMATFILTSENNEGLLARALEYRLRQLLAISDLSSWFLYIITVIIWDSATCTGPARTK